MLKQFLSPPNWFTAASIFCSTYSITLLLGMEGVVSDTLAKASVLIVFGGVFDLLDGRVARLTNRESEFGVQLDSLADVISFGVAPALLAWSWKLHTLGFIGALIIFWYILCGCFRLARFNVHVTDDTDIWPHMGHSQGLTSTMAGGSLVTLIWVANGYLKETMLSEIPAVMLAIVVVVLGLLMVSSVPFRSFKDVRQNPTARRILAVVTAISLSGAIFLNPSMLFGICGALYFTWGLADGLATAMLSRKESATSKVSIEQQ